ncbi:radical SAM protein [Eubacterium sp. MSJ-13]|nr:radical SAM protein [Eubacterium sp. MSJ-13]
MAIWTIGCHKRCKKCANPELRMFDKTKNISVEQLENMILKIDIMRIDGITISGGEPFAQPSELKKFLQKISSKVEDILVFSGYTYEELLKIQDSDVQECFKYIGVLISGEYIDEKNDNKTALIASTNQKIYFLKENLKEKYKKYMDKGRQIQNIFWKDELMSVGIHNSERSV